MEPCVLQMEGALDTIGDMTEEMAALGLPRSFISRLGRSPSTAKKKSERKYPSITRSTGAAGADDSKHESRTAVSEFWPATRENNFPLGNFRIRSVRLYTRKKDSGFEVEGFGVLDCSRIDTQEDSTLIDSDGNGGNVRLTCDDRREHTKVDVDLDGAEETFNIAESVHVRWEPFWDEQYQCYYFYNTRTGQSTWEEPPGYESYAATNALGAAAHHQTNSSIYIEKNTMGVSDQGIDSEAGRDSGSSEVSLIRGSLVEQLANDDVEDDEGLLSSCGLGNAEATGESEEKLDNGLRGEIADLIERKGSLVETPFLSDITNSHIRFNYSDESSSCSSLGEGEDGETDWNEMEEILSQRVKKDVVEGDNDDGCEACSPSSQLGVSSIHSKVRQHIKASKMCIKKRQLSSLSGVDQLDEVQLPGMAEMISKKLIKYWIQRYSLFTKFDEGIKMDEEGWFSVTPETIAKHQASRCGTGLVIDAFTGVGGNAIQFALRSHQVIAVDIDPIKVEYARHNAEIYGVADKIEYIVGDFFQLAPFLKADLVFLSPPWGGPEYLKQEIYDLHTMLQPKDGCTLFKAAQSIAPNIALFVPRNVDFNHLQELSWLASPPLPCEIEENYVNDKLKAITAYYGDIAGEDL